MCFFLNIFLLFKLLPWSPLEFSSAGSHGGRDRQPRFGCSDMAHFGQLNSSEQLWLQEPSGTSHWTSLIFNSFNSCPCSDVPSCHQHPFREDSHSQRDEVTIHSFLWKPQAASSCQLWSSVFCSQKSCLTGSQAISGLVRSSFNMVFSHLPFYTHLECSQSTNTWWFLWWLASLKRSRSWMCFKAADQFQRNGQLWEMRNA